MNEKDFNQTLRDAIESSNVLALERACVKIFHKSLENSLEEKPAVKAMKI